MHFRPSSRTNGGFTLIELLVVILIISLLLTLGAVGLRGLGGKGVTSAVTTTEALFDEARAIAVGKGTKSRILVDVSDPQDMENYKRRIFIAYLELDEKGEPNAENKWVVASRATLLPERVFFSQTFSKKEQEKQTPFDTPEEMNFDKKNFNGKYLAYEFNSEGICATPGASFVVGTGARPQGDEPRVTGEGKRDFGGFVVWRNGRTSLFRGPDEMEIPAEVTTF